VTPAEIVQTKQFTYTTLFSATQADFAYATKCINSGSVACMAPNDCTWFVAFDRKDFDRMRNKNVTFFYFLYTTLQFAFNSKVYIRFSVVKQQRLWTYQSYLYLWAFILGLIYGIVGMSFIASRRHTHLTMINSVSATLRTICTK